MKKIFFLCLIMLLPIICRATENPGSIIREYDKEYNLKREFYAYDQNSGFGVKAIVEDFNGDGHLEIITVPQVGGGPQIQMFNVKGKLLKPGWFCYAEDFRGGVNLAAADINGDEIKDLIVVPTSDAQALIKVYNLAKKEPKEILSFLAFPDTFTGGAYIAAGNVNKDSGNEIIVGAGGGGGPQIRVFNNQGTWTGVSFFPFAEDFRGGVQVAVGDVDKLKGDEIVVGPASDAQALVKIYNGKGNKIINQFLAFPQEVEYGVTLALGNISGSEKKEILAGPGNLGGPQIRIFKTNGKNIGNFFGYTEDFRGQTNVYFNEEKKIFFITPILTKRIIKGPKIALTFDDGYSSNNGSLNKILNILKARNLQVTFFLLGDWIEDHPSEIQRIIDDGHEIANHSYHHPLFTTLTESQIKQEIESTANLLKSMDIDPWPNFRYPYGGHNAYTDAVIAELGYHYWHWTASTGDTGPNPTITSVTNGALANMHDGGIILAHCSSDATAAALDNIIDVIQNSGYNIVKISELNN